MSRITIDATIIGDHTIGDSLFGPSIHNDLYGKRKSYGKTTLQKMYTNARIDSS